MVRITYFTQEVPDGISSRHPPCHLLRLDRFENLRRNRGITRCLLVQLLYWMKSQGMGKTIWLNAFRGLEIPLSFAVREVM